MKITIFGLGYVGAVSAGCLAKAGHDVLGVDPNGEKVDLVNAGSSPIIEADIDDIIRETVETGALRATTEAAQAISGRDLSIVCVGTPSRANGDLDTGHVSYVCTEIGDLLRAAGNWHVVAIRSTVLPGTTRDLVIPTLENSSGKKAGQDFGVCFHPEFMREGSAVADFYDPPKTVIGATDERSAKLVASLYDSQEAPLVHAEIETAEMVKYADNAWHALKVGFANEIGTIAKNLGIDGHVLMDLFCLDTKLNVSARYLKPGFAFGGSCLPKDLRALTYKARTLDLDVPILGAIAVSNEHHTSRGLEMILAKGNKKVGVLGFTFKAGTDDLRESPMVEVIERLIGKGYDVRLYDRRVSLAKVTGANREYILERIPHISKLMVDSVDEILAHAETVVIGTSDDEFADVAAKLREGQAVVDFARVGEIEPSRGDYDGICW